MRSFISRLSAKMPARTVGLGFGLAALLLTLDALARVGGGESFGGGGGGGGDGEGIGAIVEILFWLIIAVPEIGIPVTIVFVIGYALYSRASKKRLEEESVWLDHDVTIAQRANPAQIQAISKGFKALRHTDHGFSRFVFLDLCSLLFTRFHELRAGSDWGPLSAYIKADVLAHESNELDAIERVVIGAITFESVQVASDGAASIEVIIEANMDEIAGDSDVRMYMTESWTFQRAAGVQSMPPEKVASLACPSCGAAAQTDVHGRCAYCNNVVNSGQFGWVVSNRLIKFRRIQPDMALQLSMGGDETGVDYPTRFQADLVPESRAMTGRNPDFTWDDFRNRVTHVFYALQKAWSERSWGDARPYETDNLYQVHRYWMERYERQKLWNRLDDVNLERIEVARVERDAYFETITVRVYASMRDYIIEEDGTVVGGNLSVARRFSEYWTFIRRSGHKPKAQGSNDSQCPSCGAPLQITQTGMCNVCKSVITTGDFDWVLALIEQDEVYVP
jgi:predicted lipid-binding transport protein (Tim44 family)